MLKQWWSQILRYCTSPGVRPYVSSNNRFHTSHITLQTSYLRRHITSDVIFQTSYLKFHIMSDVIFQMSYLRCDITSDVILQTSYFRRHKSNLWTFRVLTRRKPKTSFFFTCILFSTNNILPQSQTRQHNPLFSLAIKVWRFGHAVGMICWAMLSCHIDNI